jgi:phosphoglycerate kinase
MANTFLLSQGFELGSSLVEEDLISEASDILEKSKHYNVNIILPVDLVCSQGLEDKENIKIVDTKNILSNQIALDIGDKSIKLIKSVILKSKMILWNGPLGVFEHKPFDHATNEIAKIIKTDTKNLNIITCAGGGDTIAAIKKAKAEKYFTYISNAGGAFLEWLEGKESPGVLALKKNRLS